MPHELEDLNRRLNTIEQKLENITATLYGKEMRVGLVGEVYDLKQQIRFQNKLIYTLLTISTTELIFIIDILSKLGA